MKTKLWITVLKPFPNSILWHSEDWCTLLPYRWRRTSLRERKTCANPWPKAFPTATSRTSGLWYGADLILPTPDGLGSHAFSNPLQNSQIFTSVLLNWCPSILDETFSSLGAESELYSQEHKTRLLIPPLSQEGTDLATGPSAQHCIPGNTGSVDFWLILFQLKF